MINIFVGILNLKNIEGNLIQTKKYTTLFLYKNLRRSE